jgi:hypothetical protein
MPHELARPIALAASMSSLIATANGLRKIGLIVFALVRLSLFLVRLPWEAGLAKMPARANPPGDFQYWI